MHTNPTPSTPIPHHSPLELLIETIAERENRLREAVEVAPEGALRRVLLKTWWQSQEQLERLEAFDFKISSDESMISPSTTSKRDDLVESLLKAEHRLLELCDASLAALPQHVRPTILRQREELAMSITRLAAFRLLIN